MLVVRFELADSSAGARAARIVVVRFELADSSAGARAARIVVVRDHLIPRPLVSSVD
jgi:hypothetical protein